MTLHMLWCWNITVVGDLTKILYIIFRENFIFASIVDFDGWGITARYFYIRKHEALQIMIFMYKSTITKSWNK